MLVHIVILRSDEGEGSTPMSPIKDHFEELI